MTPRLYLRYFLRESRGARGRLAFFVLCLAVGVAAVVAVAALSDSLDSAVQQEARQLLAADLKVESRRPLPPELETFVQNLDGAQRTNLLELPTVVAASPAKSPDESSASTGRSRLAKIKAIDGTYPFYGNLELDPARPLDELLDAESTLAAPELLEQLGLSVGDQLSIGGESFRIAGRVLKEPDQVGIAFTLGPRVLLSAAGLERTGLTGFGSRIEYQALIRLPEPTTREETDRIAEELRQALPSGGIFSVETYAEAQPALRRGLRQIERFLGLVALVSLLVGGIGVAQTVRAWLAGRMDAIAVLKCLGLRPREVLAVYLGQAVILGAAGSLAGCIVGLLLPLAAPQMLGDLIPRGAIRLWQPWAAARGFGLGVGVAALFSLPPLMTLRRIPPVRVLRRDAQPVPASRPAAIATASVLILGVFALASAQAGSLLLGLQFTAGALIATAVLAGAALGVTRAVGRLPQSWRSLWLRYGLASVGRPGAGTLGAIVALGLGVMVVLTMSLVQSSLSDQLTRELPEDAPSVFLVDIQPDQWPGVEEILADQGATSVDSVPVVMARLSAIDGTPVEEIMAEEEAIPEEEVDSEQRERRWALTREQRLTYLDQLPEDNVVLDGALWQADGVDEVSVEEGFAEELGIGVGSTLGFDVQGVDLQLAVTSVRSVDWESFGINFFLVVEPGVLDGAPHFRIAAARLPRVAEQSFQDAVVSTFPNVTVLRIRDILEKIGRSLGRLGLGVRFLGGFTVLAGLAILAGAVSASSSRRGREVALLKTLGFTRGGVVAVFAAEYALVGMVAGTIGAVAGGVHAYFVLTQGMELDWTFQLLPYLLTIAGTVLLTVTAGCITSARALTRRPVAVLREEV
ncbi:MAG: FtsX-like permease family protein [Acidobacteriota bacterium]|nr:FtsX-like permease family protein [Acidobacteriota bacterium]